MNNWFCIYHGNCNDGFASAWVVRRALGHDVTFYPGVYNDPPPDITGKDVILVDFSYQRSILEQMVKDANSVLILDHHKTALENLEGLEDATTVFDMERSGAHITWDYFFPLEDPPQLLLHIEDRDLWRFALPNTREIIANCFSYPYDFSVYDQLMNSDISNLISDGKAIERKHFKDINELLSIVTRPMIIGGYNVDVANLTYVYSSDAGAILAKGKPFGACYWDTPKGRVFSLRSTDEGEDVSNIAKLYGGGGHRNASGFRVSFKIASEFEISQ